LRVLRHECTFPPHMDVVIDGRLAGGKSYRYLHARLKIIDHQRQGQEQQFGFRVLTHDNASAFQNRLKAAMGDAGIDKRLAFRSLTVVRNDLPPKGAKTEKLVGQFGRMGGRWATISKEEIRTLHAVQELLKSHGAEAHDWIRERRPISEIGFIRVSGLLEAIAALGDGPSQPPEPATPAPPVSPSPTPTRETPPPAPSPTSRPPSSKASGALHLGVREQAGGKLGAPILVPWVDLTRHTLVVAGSGSGKTNLLKRIVEEATIKGIPSIVVDCNNDLIGLGEKRPPKAVPTEWTDDWR